MHINKHLLLYLATRFFSAFSCYNLQRFSADMENK